MIPDYFKSQHFEKPPLITDLSTPRYSFPLSLRVANKCASHRMALIGDAAHRIHPMAGQGLNLGISDVDYLINTIIKAKEGGADIGNYENVLKNYDYESKLNASSVIAAIEFVKNCYSPKVLGSETLGSVFSVARNFGIDLIDTSEFAKYNFMNFASGNFRKL